MDQKTNIQTIIPVLSTADIERDIAWYKKHIGFNLTYQEEGYAVLNRENIWIHLQWHHDNDEDPVYGSVIKIFVDDINPIFEEMIQRDTVVKDKLRLNTPWNTHEFGFFDLNKNTIFFVQDI
ncbi:VOC family protein [Pontimicrobium sp. SW4]|uniref:VOC family protein n=1 Tax=Pontimicrobium sp. SW4 TaxID=3153519 RepID=A0AAU7BV30_9FLAO